MTKFFAEIAPFSYLWGHVLLGTHCKNTKDFATMQEKKQKKSPIKQRILYFVEKLGISKREFYAEVGISRGTLESQSGITEEVMAKFIATYPQVNVQWLVTGEGDMTKQNGQPTIVSEPSMMLTSENAGIPLIPIEAAAGFFQGEQNVLLRDCQRFQVPIFSDADYLIPIKGDSMLPNYSSGDIVACQRINAQSTFFQWGKVYVVDTEQGVLIKRLFEGTSPATIRLVSDNAKYPPIEVPRAEIYHMSVVLGTLRLE